ncbi:Uncharacterised protein [Mycobacteroides abscessus subsp. abscessus]|uniref:hypothetical protein n=1 Tax=Mycobacteroides abscessus TaxID=36809 RepID=UPI0009A87CA1|nr:hypothetical protein [Mycobacteroides abscessus]SLI00708.1 Uncharacterised protein [Mycobacteroides abscessus subsp. abscessus]
MPHPQNEIAALPGDQLELALMPSAKTVTARQRQQLQRNRPAVSLGLPAPRVPEAAVPCKTNPQFFDSTDDKHNVEIAKTQCRLHCPRRVACAREALAMPGIGNQISGVIAGVNLGEGNEYGTSKERKRALEHLQVIASYGGRVIKQTMADKLRLHHGAEAIVKEIDHPRSPRRKPWRPRKPAELAPLAYAS